MDDKATIPGHETNLISEDQREQGYMLKSLNKQSSFKKILLIAENYKEVFLKKASEDILKYGTNSIFNDLDQLFEHYYYTHYFTQISRRIKNRDIIRWTQDPHFSKDSLIQSLKERVKLRSESS